ncbi:MAG: MBL fold metallo-hydrolase [Clostridia bacterium]|nr:MBL fold metallo-hydrolase [Clostridia bacterium]
MSTEVKVTYFHHSGFTVAVDKTLLVFDYWRGEEKPLRESECLNAKDLAGFDRVLFFVSHEHPDHYDPVIYDFENLPGVSYIIADDMPKEAKGIRMAEGNRKKFGEVIVTAFGSTDPGVSWYVEIGGVHIFHAGDLNLWHWREESSAREILYAEEAFYRKVEAIAGLPIDLCMFPLDPRMRRMYEAGANHFIMTCKPRIFIPMHWQGRAEIANDFARRCRTKFTTGIALTQPREYAEISYGDTAITVNLCLAGTGDEVPVRRRADEKKTPVNPLPQDDPFAGSDLPVDRIAEEMQREKK